MRRQSFVIILSEMRRTQNFFFFQSSLSLYRLRENQVIKIHIIEWISPGKTWSRNGFLLWSLAVSDPVALSVSFISVFVPIASAFNTSRVRICSVTSDEQIRSWVFHLGLIRWTEWLMRPLMLTIRLLVIVLAKHLRLWKILMWIGRVVLVLAVGIVRVYILVMLWLLARIGF